MEAGIEAGIDARGVRFAGDAGAGRDGDRNTTVVMAVDAVGNEIQRQRSTHKKNTTWPSAIRITKAMRSCSGSGGSASRWLLQRGRSASTNDSTGSYDARSEFKGAVDVNGRARLSEWPGKNRLSKRAATRDVQLRATHTPSVKRGHVISHAHNGSVSSASTVP